jgi:hypothetical protein
LICSKLSRYVGTVAIAVLLGCANAAYALPSADRLQPVPEAQSSNAGSHQPPARYDDEVCAAGTIDRSSCDLEDRATSAVETTDTGGAPEPQTYALMLAGLGAAGFLARRRQPLQG